MKKYNFSQKRKPIDKERRREKLYYNIFVVLIVLRIINYYFFTPTTIGHDNRYTIYVFLLPNLLGILLLAIYRKDFLLQRLAISNKLLGKLIVVIFYFIQGFLFSYSSIGLVSEISFNYLNKKIAKESPTEIITSEITRFWTGRRPHIEFKFNNRYEKFTVSYKIINEYKDKSSKDYMLKISARKGLWDYYLVESWNIKNR